MGEEFNFSNASSRDNNKKDSHDYLNRASSAVESGDQLLGIHLYLAAFEQSMLESIVPSDESLGGMRKAWDLAIAGHQHSLAEYIFEKLKPYVSSDELAHKADELQDVALDRLEEFGFSRDTIEDMAELINEDLITASSDLLYQFEEENGSGSSFNSLDFLRNNKEAQEDILAAAFSAPIEQRPQVKSQEKPPAQKPASASAEAGAISEAKVPEAPAAPEAKTPEAKKPEELAGQKQETQKQEAQKKQSQEPLEVSALSLPKGLKGAKITQINIGSGKKNKKRKNVAPRLDYSTIVGYESAIKKMGRFGVGKMRDPEFRAFIESLNFKHGLSRMPQLGTVVFNSQSREDANYFMVATVGEMRVPAVRMRMDENASGQSVLCVMASPDVVTGQQSLDHFGVEGPGALILEDLDLWDMPWMDMSGADFAAFLQMQLSRGAREAMQFIQSALENPEVSVFISASNLDALDALFGPMLGLYRVVEIDQPSAEERKDIWRHAQEEHPSMRGLDLGQMVPFSNGLSRFELYAIITEAVEEAYRRSIEKECFCAVRTDDVLMRLSNFFELDSEEYQGIEAVVLDHFHHSMDFIDNLLKED